AEHFNRGVHEWGCTAVPVRDPETDTLLGVIDLTGGDEAVAGHTLSLVEATVAAVEAELRMNALRSQIERGRSTMIALGNQPGTGSGGPSPRKPRPAPPVAPSVRLTLLGREPALLEGAGTVLELGNRHAEILTALSAEPAGLSAAQLAERVYGRGNAVATLRPEMVRLRRVLEQSGQDARLLSRPYRLSIVPVVDAAETLAALARGAHRLALAGYTGPVLPGSNAPVIEQLRNDVEATLREAMLADAAPDLLFDYAQAWADQDAEVWETLLTVLPARSPKRARVLAKLNGFTPSG
ncbi:transcriptional regulator, partial [Leucobacter sp. M11]|nr:transcriptional regulator [Leucobacter sp. M11]